MRAFRSIRFRNLYIKIYIVKEYELKRDFLIERVSEFESR